MTDNQNITLMGDAISEFTPKNFTFFTKPTFYDISEIKLEGLKKFAEIIQWGRRNPVKFCERFYGIEFLDYQKYVFMMSWVTPNVIWCMSRSAGKALDLNTRIPTPYGDKAMQMIHVGDYVFNEHGSPTLVTYESPIYYNHDCYKVVFDDSEEIIADADHNWYVNAKSSLSNKCDNITITTKEMYKSFAYISNSAFQYRYSVMRSDLDKKKNHIYNDKIIVKIEKVKSRPVKCIKVASDSHLYLCGEKDTVTHNTTLGSPFLMAKTMLVPKFEAYILSSTGSQSIGMMKKIESIARKEISSFTGLTDVFLNELVKTANSDGFKHDPASYSYKLYSGSSLATINSNFDASRGRRSRLNFYDEASYVSEDMFVATLPFVAQNSEFALGGDVDVTLLPPNFPNQVICASSAGSMDDTFYRRYKEASMHSFGGDKNYFCADIDCDIVINATYNGKLYPVPLLTQAKIDAEMKMNPTKATREYKNKFDSDLGDDIAVKKSQVLRNSVVRPPMLVNEDNSLMVICFDPAKKRDNSFVLIGKLHRDEKRGWLLDVVNGINLIDKETKRPLTTPEQVRMLQDIVVRYNGYGVPDYKNIHGIYIDAGSGGGATQICDLLFDDFYEENHEKDNDFKHHGLIDASYEYAIPYVKRYPDAVDVIRMKEPTRWKTTMYTQLCEMIDQDLISFTAEYDYHGNLTMLSEEDGEVVENNYKLSIEEEVGLKQLDAMKEELTHMYKYKSSNGNIRYDLAAGFDNILHDDRAYCMALMGHALFELRSKDMVRQKRKSKSSHDLVNILPIHQGKRFSTFNLNFQV